MLYLVDLEKEGFRTVAAYDGEEALLIAAEQVPDLLVLDWTLPHRSGLDVCQHLRRDSKTSRAHRH